MSHPFLAGCPAAGDSASVSALVSKHADTFPWYRELLAAQVGKTAKLEDLPVIDETLLLRHYYNAPAGELPGADAYYTSGTSTGTRKRILYSARDHERYIEQRRLLLRGFLAGLPANSTGVADLGTGHAAASARRIFEELGFTARDIDFTRPITEHVSLLNEWRPDVLFTMPMILERLISSDSLRIAPRRIILLGDVAPEDWRRQIASYFGIKFSDVLDVFGSIEVGAIAYFCAETGLYHFHDHILPEVLPPSALYTDCDDAAKWETGSGILLLTSFDRDYFPALRFATNDVIRGLRTIDWMGRPFRVFDRIEGRYGGELKHGERISHYDLVQAVTAVFPGAGFHVVNDGHLEILIAGHVDSPRAAELRERLFAANLDVKQMTDSGLVGEIVVRGVPVEDLPAGGGKRFFTVKGAKPCAV